MVSKSAMALFRNWQLTDRKIDAQMDATQRQRWALNWMVEKNEEKNGNKLAVRASAFHLILRKPTR